MKMLQGLASTCFAIALAVLIWLVVSVATAKAGPPVARVKAQPPVARIANCGCDRAGCPSCSGCIGSCGIVSKSVILQAPVYRSFTQGTTQATTVPVVVPHNTTKVEAVQYGELTYTLAPGAAQYGITSGCAGGNCPAQQTQSRGLFWRFR